MRFACAVLVLLLAGCAAAPRPAPTSPAAPSATASSAGPQADAEAAAVAAGPGQSPTANAPAVTHQRGVFGPEAMTGLTGPVGPASGNVTMRFDVPGGAKAIVVELVWADPDSTLDLMASGPEYCAKPQPADFLPCAVNVFYGDPNGTGAWRSDGALPGRGPRAVRIALAAEQWKPFDCGDDPCRWAATALAKETPGTAFDLYASVFPSGDPPAGYSAVPNV